MIKNFVSGLPRLASNSCSISNQNFVVLNSNLLKNTIILNKLTDEIIHNNIIPIFPDHLLYTTTMQFLYENKITLKTLLEKQNIVQVANLQNAQHGKINNIIDFDLSHIQHVKTLQQRSFHFIYFPYCLTTTPRTRRDYFKILNFYETIQANEILTLATLPLPSKREHIQDILTRFLLPCNNWGIRFVSKNFFFDV